MEFLIGRSLTNNITNLLLSPFVDDVVKRTPSIGSACSKRSPTPGWATGLGRLAACFLDSMATMEIPASVRAPVRVRDVPAVHRGRLATRAARQLASPPRPWEVVRPDDRVEIKLNCSMELRDEC